MKVYHMALLFTQLSILTHDVAAKNYGEIGVEDAGHIQQE